MTNILSKALFPIMYKSDRRKHSHRCRACWKIVEDGEKVFMLRVNRKTTVLHEACQNCGHTENNTWLDAFTCWAIQHLIALGFAEKTIQHCHPEEFNTFLKMNNRPSI